MRKTINPQPNLREPRLELEHARELETISSLLDAHPKLNELVLQDLRSVTPPAGSDVGRGGMSAEQVLRALLVKQLNRRWVWLMTFLVRTRKCSKSAAILSALARFTGSVKPDSSNCAATR